MRSRRKREHASQRNLELRWLWHKLPPDFKTMADFRQEHAHALKGVCRECTLLCNTLALFGRELIAIDGSTFNAVQRKARHCTEKKWQNLRKQIHEQSEADRKELDAQDTMEAAPNKPTPQVLQEKMEP